MTCTYAVTTGDVTRTVYCRTFDGTDYSVERTTTYTVDTTAPAGGSITYTDGYYTTASIPITYTAGTDGGSGLNNASGKIQRASTTLTNGICGSYSSFSDLVTEFDGAYTDTTVTSGNCYKYQYLIQDAATNQATYTSANIVKVDTTIPSTPGTPDLTAASDTGQSSTDNITKDTTPSFAISCETDATVTIFSGSTALGTGTCATSTVTITSSALSTDGSYAIKAKQRNPAGTSSATGSALPFTLDTTTPILSTLSPADNTTGISTTANLTITFSEAIGMTGTGYVTIYQSSDDSIVERINTATGAVTGSGTLQIIINPTITLANSTAYSIKIDGMAFPDSAGNFFAGITNATTWNFTTEAAAVTPAPTIPIPTPPAGGNRGLNWKPPQINPILRIIPQPAPEAPAALKPAAAATAPSSPSPTLPPLLKTLRARLLKRIETASTKQPQRKSAFERALQRFDARLAKRR